MEGTRIILAILTRNRPDCLKVALSAAVAGEELPDEIVVSDDSDEAQAGATRSVVDAFPPARYVRGPQKGLGANENHLIANAGDGWIVFNGDDARVSPGFIKELRKWIAGNQGKKIIPSGYEIRNGEHCLPNRLDFFGYQRVPYSKYSPGMTLETVVVQATAFPMDLMRAMKWLEVTKYGYDEVDMAHKVRKAGYRIQYEPLIWLYHDHSQVGRNEYPTPAEIARLYVSLRIHSIYQPNRLKWLVFVAAAPLQLLFAFARRGMWNRFFSTFSTVGAAYKAYFKSRNLDWKQC